jgi:hypothetical protein
MTEHEHNSIREKLHEAISSGHVVMRPKWHFVFKTILVAIGAVIVFIALLFFISFIIFVLHSTGVWFIPGFGLAGIYAFLVAAPWLLILPSLAFVLVLELLVRRYEFGYRQPLIYTVLGILGCALLGGTVVAGTSLHKKFARFADDHELPVARDLYHKFGDAEFGDIHPGSIIATTTDGFIMDMVRHAPSVIVVHIASTTDVAGDVHLVQNEMVLVFGDLMQGEVQAVGVRLLPPGPARERATLQPMFR